MASIKPDYRKDKNTNGKNIKMWRSASDYLKNQLGEMYNDYQ